MEKIIRDGMIAVAVSYGYGAGWSTWNGIDPRDARFNQLFLDGDIDEIVRICDEEDLYAGGASGVAIEWVPDGTKFRIDEYDGSESLVTEDEDPWVIA